MDIDNIEYMAPTKANPVGSIKANIILPVAYEEGVTKPVKDGEAVAVQVSEETASLFVKAMKSLIKDIDTVNHG